MLAIYIALDLRSRTTEKIITLGEYKYKLGEIDGGIDLSTTWVAFFTSIIIIDN